MSIGLGGGSHVSGDVPSVGPTSVGYELPQKAFVYGGDVLTATDIAVAAGLADIGDSARVRHLGAKHVSAALDNISAQLLEVADRMKPDANDLPLLAVGGGAILAPERLPGFSEVVRVKHHEVANAVGAAMAQISGEVDRVFHDLPREEVLKMATKLARDTAVQNGADESTLKVVDREDLPLAYLPGNAVRARVRVVGDIAPRSG